MRVSSRRSGCRSSNSKETLVAHRTPRLNGYGRQLLVTRVLGLGWSVPVAAEAMGVSRATGYKWIRRYRMEGLAGLADRTSRPHRSPQRTAAARSEAVLAHARCCTGVRIACVRCSVSRRPPWVPSSGEPVCLAWRTSTARRASGSGATSPVIREDRVRELDPCLPTPPAEGFDLYPASERLAHRVVEAAAHRAHRGNEVPVEGP